MVWILDLDLLARWINTLDPVPCLERENVIEVFFKKIS